jgi:FAD/FMN-containing dehydrogenase
VTALADALELDEAAFRGAVFRPGDPGYDEHRKIWNGCFDKRPAVIVRCAGVSDVIAAVKLGRTSGLPVAVKSGGHSFPGQSVADDALMIDLEPMKGVRVDPAQHTARVQAGVLLGELDRETQAFGLAVPSGIVTHTGVAGLTLGGGIGWIMRKHGLSVDQLVSVDLVTADGEFVKASADENADLFWGLRGAGANFGIATSFEFRLHQLEGPVTHGTVVHPVERAGELAGLFRERLATGPDELWMSFAIGLAEPGGEPVATVSAHHCGPVAEAERDLAPLRAFGPPVADSLAAKAYLEAQHLNDEAMEWGHRFYMKSAFLHSLPDELVDRMAEHVSRVPEGADAGFSIWAWGRAIAAVPEDATAFTGRGAEFWMAAEIMWDDAALDDRCREWGRAALADAAPFASAGRYVNDVAEPDERLTSIYGAAKAERLVGLKRAWDPDNVFRLNQNVQP